MMPPNIIWRIYHRHDNGSGSSSWLDSSPEMEKYREERERQFCKEFIIVFTISSLIASVVFGTAVYLGLHPDVVLKIIQFFE